jgi:hypothetical protein
LIINDTTSSHVFRLYFKKQAALYIIHNVICFLERMDNVSLKNNQRRTMNKRPLPEIADAFEASVKRCSRAVCDTGNTEINPRPRFYAR